MTSWTPQTIARTIDHTLLKSDALSGEIDRLCDEAVEHGFAAVCIAPCHVTRAAGRLSGSPVAVCTVVDFPLGAGTPPMKADDARRCAELGARELDMVINLSALRDGRLDEVKDGVRAVVEAVDPGIVVKAIVEICYLSPGEIEAACLLCREAGADFVKTSTGFGTGGATLEAVALMRRTVGETMGVKAAGGIHDFETARAMLEAGATRIGASAGVAIVNPGH